MMPRCIQCPDIDFTKRFQPLLSAPVTYGSCKKRPNIIKCFTKKYKARRHEENISSMKII